MSHNRRKRTTDFSRRSVPDIRLISVKLMKKVILTSINVIFTGS